LKIDFILVLSLVFLTRIKFTRQQEAGLIAPGHTWLRHAVKKEGPISEAGQKSLRCTKGLQKLAEETGLALFGSCRG